MGHINPGFPVLLRYDGDILHDFADKYIKEVKRIYSLMSAIRKLAPTYDYNDVEPEAGQLAIVDGALCLRNETNTEWIWLADMKYNFGFTSREGERVLTTDDLSTREGEIGKIPVTDENGLLPCSITGNAGRLGGRQVRTDRISDGQGLFFRSSINAWRNEAKGAIGSGKALTIRDGENILAIYDGGSTCSVDIGVSAQRAVIAKMLEEANKLTTSGITEAREKVDAATATLNDWLAASEPKISDGIKKHNESPEAHADIRSLINTANSRIASMQSSIASAEQSIAAIKKKLGLS